MKVIIGSEGETSFVAQAYGLYFHVPENTVAIAADANGRLYAYTEVIPKIINSQGWNNPTGGGVPLGVDVEFDDPEEWRYTLVLVGTKAIIDQYPRLYAGLLDNTANTDVARNTLVGLYGIKDQINLTDAYDLDIAFDRPDKFQYIWERLL